MTLNPALASVGKEINLGTEPATYLQTFNDWYEHHSLLAESTGVTDKNQTLKLLLLWGGKDFRRFCTDAGVQTTGEDKDTLETAVDKIRKSCGAHVNLTMTMYQLFQTEQGTKPVTTFAKEIEEKATQCQFDTKPYT